MTTLREAAQQALEALEEIADEVFSPYDNKLGDAILALRAALAETERPATLTKPCGSLGEDVSLCRYPDCVGGQAGTICHNWCPGCR